MFRTRRWARLAALAGMLLARSGGALAGGLSPQEARDRMVVPEGFRVEVFASEPDIRQPVAACFDERGRMWVIEYLQYPAPAGLVPVKVDQYLRTEYDRVPEPPPKGPRGADRIKILEDIDGDGKADKVTTFAEGLNLASGLAVGHGGVFVGQAPYLLFYPDRDRDDKPDGDPEVLLSGFGLQDAHATVNSLAWGPDGWLYGAQGSTVTAKIRGVEFQQGIWRYHPKTRQFELFSEGGGNTWGLDFDQGGRIFGSSNGGFVAFHMEQGGYSWKGFAKHGPLHNPRTYGYFNSIEYTGPKPGGHVTPGGIIYKADQFPEPMRGALLGGNLLANTAYWYTLAPKGSTFSMKLGGTLLDAKDPWFRPIDLLTGPDGSVFVVDWYDKRASHLDPRDTWDKTNGRIYKLTYRKAEPLGAFDLSKRSSEELLNLRTHPNDWWSETARRILDEREDRSLVARLRTLVTDDTDEALALRDLWALKACGGFDEGFALRMLDHRLAGVRRWSVRLLGDGGSVSPALAERLTGVAEAETDPTVRAQIAASCGRLAASQALPILDALVLSDRDAGDEHIPLLIWWAYEKALRSAPDAVLDRLRDLGKNRGGRLALYHGFLLERIARALAEDGDADSLARCARLLSFDATPAATGPIIAGMEKALQGRRFDVVPPSARVMLETLWSSSSSPSIDLVKLSARLGDDKAHDRAVAMALDAKTPASDRVALCELLGQSARAEDRTALLEILSAKGNPSPVRLAALNGLAGFGDIEIAQRLVSLYPDLPAPLRDRARDLLCGRRAWAAVLLDAIEAGTIPAKDLKTAQVIGLAALGETSLTARLESAWGRLPVRNSAEKTRRIAEIRGLLPEGDKGDPSRGAAVFRNTCAACHRLFNEGERIGPDLTGAERGELDFLLTSLVDPSAVIRKEYEGQTLALKDGRVLTGLVVEEDGQTLTLFDGQKQKTTIPKSDVEEKKAATVSVMPEGLLDAMTETQIRDLFRYLQSSGPRPSR